MRAAELIPDQAFADDDDDRIAALDLDYRLLFGRRVAGDYAHHPLFDLTVPKSDGV